MTDQLTTKSQEAVSAAVRTAGGAGNPNVEPIHLLRALLAQGDGTTRPLLAAVGVDADQLIREADAVAARLPSASGPSVGAPAASGPFYRVLTTAGEIAAEIGDEYVSTEHLLVALSKVDSPARDLLTRAGASSDRLRAAFAEVRGSAKVTSPDPEGQYKALEKYGIDLTARAREGKVDPVIGRDAEIRRVVQVLSRRDRKSVV